MSNQVTNPPTGDYSPNINTQARRAFFDNLPDDMSVDQRTEMAIAIDEAIYEARSDEWRGNEFKEREVCYAITRTISDKFGDDTIDIEKIFNIVKNQDEY